MHNKEKMSRLSFGFPKKSANVEENDSIMRQIITLAIPVIATSFMSMAYNFINIMFVGRLGSEAVAAVGSSAFYMNLSWGISALITVGTGIKVSHAFGEKNETLAKKYIKSGMVTIILLAILYFLFIMISARYLIGFIRLRNVGIEESAITFLRLIGMNVLFSFQNLFFTSVFIGYGDSRTPFRINTTAFLLNMVLDPLLIFAAGMGINGAAIATIFSQAAATTLFYIKIRKASALYPVGISFHVEFLRNILKLGLSPTIQRISFTITAIIMARIISNWGATAIAVQKVGVQIEAISYMTAGGFMSALTTISGKAFGARDYHKQLKAFNSGLKLAFVIGSITTGILLLFPQNLFSLFLKDSSSVSMGREYLIILSFSQMFMCLEFMATGAFFGWGRTHIPAISGILLTVLRIPLALSLIHFWRNSLSSVWWSISLSSVAKGILLVTLFILLFRIFLEKQKKLIYESHSA